MRTWQTLGRTSSAGNQGEGRDSKLGFAPAVFAGSTGVLEVTGWLAGWQVERSFSGRKGLKRQFPKPSAEAGETAEVAKDNMKGRRGGATGTLPATPPVTPTGNVGATVNSFGDASVPPLPLAWGRSLHAVFLLELKAHTGFPRRTGFSI